jgi:hypothetical protein
VHCSALRQERSKVVTLKEYPFWKPLISFAIGMRTSLLLATLTLLTPTFADPPPSSFAVLDPSKFSKFLTFGSGDGGGATDENKWARTNIPYFECDSEDYNIAYYFRWHMFHSHMNATGWVSNGKPRYLITEFTGVTGAHSGSAGHHIMEARWLRDPRVVTDYADYWASGSLDSKGQFRGPGHSYSFWFSWASFEAYKVLDPATSKPWLAAMYRGLRAMYIGQWVTGVHPGHGGVNVHGDGTNGMQVGQSCFYKIDGYDAEENSISGNGCRAISNACGFGEASGMGRIAAAVNGSAEEAALWTNLTQQFRSTLTDLLWNEQLQSFSTLAVVPPNQSYPNPPKINGHINYSMTCSAPEYEEVQYNTHYTHSTPY